MEYVLSIAGLDPTGGAGILADVKTFHNCGVPGFAVSTSTTYQDANTFHGVQWIDVSTVIEQLKPLLKEYSIRTVKIGLIENLNSLAKVVEFIRTNAPNAFITWDPIIAASSGFVFHETIHHDQLLSVLKTIDCITPNIPEFEVLASAIGTLNPTEFPVKHLILKDGHGDQSVVRDELFINGVSAETTSRKRLNASIHGSGCVFSSYLSAAFAQTSDIQLAFTEAGNYIEQLLMTSLDNLGHHHTMKSWT